MGQTRFSFSFNGHQIYMKIFLFHFKSINVVKSKSQFNYRRLGLGKTPIASLHSVVRLGEFHTCMSFLSVIRKHFEDSGLADILLEGRHYNRSVSYKIMAEALRRKFLSTFMDTHSA